MCVSVRAPGAGDFPLFCVLRVVLYYYILMRAFASARPPGLWPPLRTASRHGRHLLGPHPRDRRRPAVAVASSDSVSFTGSVDLVRMC